MPITHKPTEPTELSSSVRLYGVPVESLDLFWPDVLPLIEKGLQYADGRYSAADIHRFLVSRDMHLWIAVKDGQVFGAMITQIVLYPQKKVGLIFQLSGEGMQDWFHFLGTIEQCMKDSGCTTIELYGRPGWQKVLPDYRLAQVVLRKDL